MAILGGKKKIKKKLAWNCLKEISRNCISEKHETYLLQVVFAFPYTSIGMQHPLEGGQLQARYTYQ